MTRGFVYLKYKCITAIIPTPINTDLYAALSWVWSYAAIVVVVSLGSSPDIGGAGSTYLSVVKSTHTDTCLHLAGISFFFFFFFKKIKMGGGGGGEGERARG